MNAKTTGKSALEQAADRSVRRAAQEARRSKRELESELEEDDAELIAYLRKNPNASWEDAMNFVYGGLA